MTAIIGMENMKLGAMLLLLLFFSSAAHAAKLENVRLLDVQAGQENFELKLQVENGPSDSFFYVDIVKSDPQSFEKLVHVIKKTDRKNNYRLDLDIPSFSLSPSGSYYRSDGIVFSAPLERELSGVSSEKKKKK